MPIQYIYVYKIHAYNLYKAEYFHINIYIYIYMHKQIDT